MGQRNEGDNPLGCALRPVSAYLKHTDTGCDRKGLDAAIRPRGRTPSAQRFRKRGNGIPRIAPNGAAKKEGLKR